MSLHAEVEHIALGEQAVAEVDVAGSVGGEAEHEGAVRYLDGLEVEL